MKRQFPLFSFLSVHWQRYCIPFLSVSWVFGLVAGIFTAFSAGDFLIPMIRFAVTQPIGISGWLVFAVLPFIFSAFAHSFAEPWLLPLIGGIKCFGFGYCACGVALAFGHCGWLIRFLLLFSDIITLPLLYFFSLRHISNNVAVSHRESRLLLLTIAITGAVDCGIISPFLASLF